MIKRAYVLLVHFTTSCSLVGLKGVRSNQHQSSTSVDNTGTGQDGAAVVFNVLINTPIVAGGRSRGDGDVGDIALSPSEPVRS